MLLGKWSSSDYILNDPTRSQHIASLNPRRSGGTKINVTYSKFLYWAFNATQLSNDIDSK